MKEQNRDMGGRWKSLAVCLLFCVLFGLYAAPSADALLAAVHVGETEILTTRGALNPSSIS